MSENHDSKDQNNGHHVSENQEPENIEIISDEVLEHIYEDLNNLRELVEQDRETTQAMKQLISDLKSKVDSLENTLRNKNKGEKND